jgi:hypothetical protein
LEAGQTLNWNAIKELHSGSSLDDIRSIRLLLTERNNSDDGSSSGTVVSKLRDKSLQEKAHLCKNRSNKF